MAQYVVPVVKHFPGHGDTHEDSHVDLPVVSHDAERLRSFELQPFQRAIASGADAVMVAHLLVPAYDEQYPASLSKPIITDLLREELGFDGVVVTDDMTMGAIAEHDEFATAVVDAVLAGADQILIGHGYDRAESAIEALEEAFLSGVLSAERLEESVRRVLKLKIKYGMNDDPVGSVDIEALNEHAARVLGE
jgi:beta-N-acetylhexosaminidase